MRLLTIVLMCSVLTMGCRPGAPAAPVAPIPEPVSIVGFVFGHRTTLEVGSPSFALVAGAVEALVEDGLSVSGPSPARYVEAVKAGECGGGRAGDVSQRGLEVAFPGRGLRVGGARYAKLFVAFGSDLPPPAAPRGSGYWQDLYFGGTAYTSSATIRADAGSPAGARIRRLDEVAGLALLRPARGKGYCWRPVSAQDEVARVMEDFLKAAVMSRYLERDEPLSREYARLAAEYVAPASGAADLRWSDALLVRPDAVVPQVGAGWKPRIAGRRADGFVGVGGVDERNRATEQIVRLKLARVGGTWRITHVEVGRRKYA